jgi:hypothetical protein
MKTLKNHATYLITTRNEMRHIHGTVFASLVAHLLIRLLSEGSGQKAVRLAGRTQLHCTPNPEVVLSEATSGFFIYIVIHTKAPWLQGFLAQNLILSPKMTTLGTRDSPTGRIPPVLFIREETG